MNLHLIEENLADARRGMGAVQIELEQADQESSFYMFAPLVRRAETIFKKIEALDEIIKDLKNVRCG